jgi:hypothetical protein
MCEIGVADTFNIDEAGIPGSRLDDYHITSTTNKLLREHDQA